MKTSEQLQKIFSALISSLRFSIDHAIDYASNGIDCVILSPFEYYLESLRNELSLEDLNDAFFRRIYENVFHTGSAPYNKSHFAIKLGTFVNYALDDLTLNEYVSVSKNLSKGHLDTHLQALELWIDLDKVIELFNAHYQINYSQRFVEEFTSTGNRSLQCLMCKYSETVHLANPCFSGLVSMLGIFGFVGATTHRPENLEHIFHKHFAVRRDLLALEDSAVVSSNLSEITTVTEVTLNRYHSRDHIDNNRAPRRQLI